MRVATGWCQNRTRVDIDDVLEYSKSCTFFADMPYTTARHVLAHMVLTNQVSDQPVMVEVSHFLSDVLAF